MDWSTFVGGTSGDSIVDVAAVPDGSGDVIVTGTSSSADFPGGGNGPRPPGANAFVARVSGDGKRLIYARFIPGAASPARVAVGRDGSPVVVGITLDESFPTTPGVYQTTGTGTDIFVIKFHPTASQIVFSSRFGGSESDDPDDPFAGAPLDDGVTGVAVDASGGIVISGYTPHANFPTTTGAFDRTIGRRAEPDELAPGGMMALSWSDAFVSRLSPDGKSLTYSTFLGGDGDDEAKAVTVDSNGYITVVGETNPAAEQLSVGAPFPTTAGAFQRSFQGQEDGFVARIKPDGKGAADLRYGTILGSAGEDIAHGVAFDPKDPRKVVVSSQTDGWNWPTTPGALQRTPEHPEDEGNPDLGVTAFRFADPSGGKLEWSTLHGQISGYLTFSDVDVDGSGNVVIAGAVERTEGSNNERSTTQGTFDRTPDTAGGFLTRLSGDGKRLLYETVVDHAAIGLEPRVAAVGANSAVIAGSTFGDQFPTTPGSFDPVLNDGTLQSNVPSDGYVARFNFAPLNPADTSAPAPTLVSPANAAKFPAPHENQTGNTTVAFDWTDVNDSSGVKLYELEVSHNAEFVQQSETDDSKRLLERVTESRADVIFGQGFGNFSEDVLYWRVRTLDNANNYSPWSASRRIELGTLAQPRLAAAIITPSGVPGGTKAQGKVLLEGVAPAGGTTITLTSSDPALAGVPATVKVPAGANSATFPITTKSVSASKAVWIEAKLGEEWSAPVLWIDPAPAQPPVAGILKSLTLKQTSITAGQKTVGSLTLSAPAPKGGLVVKLVSDNTNVVQVPASILIPAGKTSATFEITTKSVTAARTAKITATAGNVKREVRLTVTPAPQTKDRLTVTLAEFRPCKKELRIEATSTSRTAVLQAFDAASGKLIGTLTNEGNGKYRARFNWAIPLKNIVIRSSQGGSASSVVRWN